jgi:hypothetical protein
MRLEDIHVGDVVVRNGYNTLGEYHEYHNGLVCEVRELKGRIVCLKILTPFLSRLGYPITMDSVFPDCLDRKIERQPIMEGDL